jgi:hexosaminidase
MKIRKILLPFFILCPLFPVFLLKFAAAAAGDGTKTASPAVVPKPARMEVRPGSFTIDPNTLILLAGQDPSLKETAGLLADRFMLAGGPLMKTELLTGENRELPAIILEISPGKSISAEGYELKVTAKNIRIKGGDAAGVFYGFQTLLQLLPPEIMKDTKLKPGITWTVPCVEIKDHPRFPYRGMHLDVSRHFFPKEFIFKYIDLIAMCRMNVFHWHLTDDNGWRIGIKKYPRLTETGAWRVDREDLPWNKRPAQKFKENATYGGFYTQDEIRVIVEYAAARHVTVIPEIEMPAHSVEVLAAYPQLSCTGGPFTVPPGSYWPNADILCAGNDSVFTFLEDVLTEVIALFPSAYIHIGGDEADKTNWKVCPKCQSRIKAEGLKDEKELQSYFISRIGKFLASKNKKMIGWDEILEGGLAPEATVMSWRGIEGGIAAARMGHDVIMTPVSHCYFDYYQADPLFEPKAIGGFTTLKKVYSFEPVPEELSREEAKYILGTQGNLWTEFIPTPEQAEYMALPRMIALAEVAWTPREMRDWDDFRGRLDSQLRRLDAMGVNYSRGSFRVDVSTFFDPKDETVKLCLTSEQPGIPIRYTLNGDDPDGNSPLFSCPVELKSNGYIKAGLFADGKLKERVTERPFLLHHATGKPLKYLEPYSYRYTAGGDGALVDGLKGTSSHRDGNWQGFLGNDMDVIIDMGKEQPIRSAAVTFLQISGSWIFFPDSVIFSLSSDGKKFHSINDYGNTAPKKSDKAQILPFSQLFPDTPARYIRVRAKNTGVCPPWHEGAGEPCWVFCDEIVVY